MTCFLKITTFENSWFIRERPTISSRWLDRRGARIRFGGTSRFIKGGLSGAVEILLADLIVANRYRLAFPKILRERLKRNLDLLGNENARRK